MMFKKKTLKIVALVCIFPFMLGWIERNKATKEDELILVSEEKEKNIGASIAKRIEDKFPPVEDPLIQKRFSDIGNKIAASSDRSDIEYTFKVLKGDDYNAFAVPGGYIYIFDKLYDEFKDDGDLAAVIAHEISHIVARHSVKKLQSSIGLTALMLLGAIVSKDRQKIRDLDIAFTYLMAAYSREDEFLADKFSIKYLKKAGFDPKCVLRSLEKLQAIHMSGPVRPYAYFKTHPFLSIRMAKVKEEIYGKMDFKGYINMPSESRNSVDLN